MAGSDDHPTLQLTCELIRRPSVTPEDAGCQQLIGERLRRSGFDLHPLRWGDVDNLWAVRGSGGPLVCFAGHTDVVPPGDLAAWHSPPFEPVERSGYLYGRGAADMKSSLAAMVTACERFVTRHPHHPGRIAFLLTSDEEGPAVDGTARVMTWLQERGERIDFCVVGEPSSSERLGDVIRNGRRGSLGATLTVRGIQGHVAYPQLAENPIHRLAPALAALVAEEWDRGNEFFPATSMQFSGIQSGTGVTNVIPGVLTATLNFRFSTAVTAAQLRARTEALLDRHGLDYRIDWQLSGEPFLTSAGALVDAAVASIHSVTGVTTQLSTGGGTSDGRFIAPAGAQVVEIGPVNASIHKIDERVRIADLAPLSEIYEGILERLLEDG